MENGRSAENEYVLLRSDRRKNLRKQLLVLKIRGEDNRGVFFGYAKTLSRGGMFIASVNPRSLGEEFDITFRLSGDDADIKCRCAVMWVRQYHSLARQNDPGMGIKFIDLDDGARKRIDEWLKAR